MRSRSIINVLTSIYYLCLVKCMMEGTQSTNTQLYFSYNKKDFSDFDFNIADDILSNDFLYRPPFGYNTPLGNFLNTFCLFYQFSKIKHDKKFERVLQNFFNSGYKKKCKCQLSYCQINFNTFLSQQYKIITKILNEDNLLKKFVIVEENDGRVFCRLNDMIELAHNDEENFDEMSEEEKIRSLKNEFFVKLNEMYLQDDLRLDYLDLFHEICDKYEANNYENEHPYMQLFNILFKLDNVYRRLIFDLINKNEKICRRFCIDEIKDTFNGYIDGILERYLNGDLPEYSIYLLAKTTAKILLNISNNLDIFSNTCEYIKSVILLKIKLKIAFEEKNFNEKSIRTLQMICLEWDIFIGNKWHL